MLKRRSTHQARNLQRTLYRVAKQQVEVGLRRMPPDEDDRRAGCVENRMSGSMRGRRKRAISWRACVLLYRRLCAVHFTLDARSYNGKSSRTETDLQVSDPKHESPEAAVRRLRPALVAQGLQIVDKGAGLVLLRDVPRQSLLDSVDLVREVWCNFAADGAYGQAYEVIRRLCPNAPFPVDVLCLRIGVHDLYPDLPRRLLTRNLSSPGNEPPSASSTLTPNLTPRA
jgi:hypothetical protein